MKRIVRGLALTFALAVTATAPAACFEFGVGAPPARSAPSAPVAPPPVPNNAWDVIGPGMLRMFEAKHVNRYGQVIDPNYLAAVLRTYTYRVDPSQGTGNARCYEGAIYEAPPGDPVHEFHESIHALEAFSGEQTWRWTSKDWAERNAYWMEFHASLWVPKLFVIENMVRRGQRDAARAEFFKLRQEFLAGVPANLSTYSRPDPTGFVILQRAGYRFDIDQAGREIERLTGVAFLSTQSAPVAGCRLRRTPPPSGTGEWVVWTTPLGWLHVGTRAELGQVEPVSNEIWGGGSGARLVKSPAPIGPFVTREQALEEVASRLAAVEREFFPTATPRETVGATFFGARVHVRLGRGNAPDSVLYIGQQYDFGEEMQIMLSFGISPRVRFAAPRWFVHATGVGTMDGPRKLDQWMLLPFALQNGRFTLPDGSGGTFGYSGDASEGPFADNYALVAAMRRHAVASIDEFASGRTIQAASVLEPAVDHGVPLCP